MLLGISLDPRLNYSTLSSVFVVYEAKNEHWTTRYTNPIERTLNYKMYKSHRICNLNYVNAATDIFIFISGVGRGDGQFNVINVTRANNERRKLHFLLWNTFLLNSKKNHQAPLSYYLSSVWWCVSCFPDFFISFSFLRAMLHLTVCS